MGLENNINLAGDLISNFTQTTTNATNGYDINTATSASFQSTTITSAITGYESSLLVTGVLELHLPLQVSLGLIVVGGLGLYTGNTQLQAALNNIVINNLTSEVDVAQILQNLSTAEGTLLLAYTKDALGNLKSKLYSKDNNIEDLLSDCDKLDSVMKKLNDLGSPLPIESMDGISISKSLLDLLGNKPD